MATALKKPGDDEVEMFNAAEAEGEEEGIEADEVGQLSPVCASSPGDALNLRGTATVEKGLRQSAFRNLSDLPEAWSHHCTIHG